MQIVTEWLHPDEPCYGLREGPVTEHHPVLGDQERWQQWVWVVRGDTLAKHVTDIGPAEDYATVTPLVMPSPRGENTVAELQAHAEKHRHDDYWYKRSREMMAGSTLVKDHLTMLEMERTVIHNRTFSAPGLFKQRNAVPVEMLSRRYKERRNARRGYTNF